MYFYAHMWFWFYNYGALLGGPLGPGHQSSTMMVGLQNRELSEKCQII